MVLLAYGVSDWHKVYKRQNKSKPNAKKKTTARGKRQRSLASGKDIKSPYLFYRLKKIHLKRENCGLDGSKFIIYVLWWLREKNSSMALLAYEVYELHKMNKKTIKVSHMLKSDYG